MASGNSKQKKGTDNVRLAARVVSVLILMAIVLLSLGIGATRTFLVDATVKGLDVEFQGQSNFWDLGSVVICTPLKKPDPRADRGDGFCDLRRYRQTTQELPIEWRDGASTQVEIEDGANLILTVANQANLDNGTRIRVPLESWDKISVLSFIGSATLGQPATSGETKLLLNASYQVREKPFWSPRTETIKLGTVRKGESVSLMHRARGTPEPARVFGYITPGTGYEDALDVGIVSQTGNTYLALRYFGGDAPAEIAPNWVDRTLSSPLILALTFLLSLGIGAIQFAVPAQAAFKQMQKNNGVRNMMRLNSTVRRRIHNRKDRRN